MPKLTYVPLATANVTGSTTSSIDFTSISQNYTDLLIKYSFRSTRSATNDYAKITFNSNTSNYAGVLLFYDGTAVNSLSFSNAGANQYAGEIPGATATTSAFGNGEIYITNYTTSRAKMYNVESTVANDASATIVSIANGRWNDTSAITSIGLTAGVSGTIVQYSTATLYGILKE